MSETIKSSTDRLQIGKILNPHRIFLLCAEKREGIVGLGLPFFRLKNYTRYQSPECLR